MNGNILFAAIQVTHARADNILCREHNVEIRDGIAAFFDCMVKNSVLTQPGHMAMQ